MSKFLCHVIQQRNKKAKKSLETDKQRTSNIKEAGTIGKRLFPCLIASDSTRDPRYLGPRPQDKVIPRCCQNIVQDFLPRVFESN